MGSKIFLRKYRVTAEEIGAVGEPGDSPLAYQAEEIDSGKKVVVEAISVASLKIEVRDKLKANAVAALSVTRRETGRMRGTREAPHPARHPRSALRRA